MARQRRDTFTNSVRARRSNAESRNTQQDAANVLVVRHAAGTRFRYRGIGAGEPLPRDAARRGVAMRRVTKKVARLKTDRQAEAFLAQDLSKLDFSQFKPARFEFEKKYG